MNNTLEHRVKSSILNDEKITAILDTSYRILEEVGIKIKDQTSLDILKAAGARIEEGSLVKIPRECIKEALATAPNIVTTYTRDGEENMVLGGENIYFGPIISCLKYLDPYTGKALNLTMEHQSIMARLSDALPNMSFVLTGAMLADCNPRISAQIAFLLALLNTKKTINFATDEAESCKELIEFAQEFAGGADALRAKPFLVHYAEPVSPLVVSGDSCQKLLLCAAAGVPIIFMPYMMMGGTAPMAFAGELAQCYAEVLAGLVIHQNYVPGAPFIIGCMPATVDMKTTVGTYGSPELTMQVAAAAEISHYFNIPFYGTTGTCDSQAIDYQAVVECTTNCLASIESYAHMCHDVGEFGHGVGVSPELMILVNEILDMQRVFRTGVIVDEEHLAFDVIKEIGPGGHYLLHNHTFEHYKDVWYSELFNHDRSENVPTANERVNIKAKDLIENYSPEPLTDQQLEMIRKYRSALEARV